MTLTGIDISGWQRGIDLTQVPADFVLIKATGGRGFINPACDAQYQSALKAGKLRGLYHFAHEGGFQSDAVSEANFFVDNIKGYLNGDVVLVLDFEGDNQRDVGWSKAWLDQVFARTGVRPVIYLNTAELRQSDWSPVFKANYGLWVAQYAVTSPTSGYNNYAGTPAVNDTPPAVNWGGVGPLMWQFADNARLPGYGGGLDADVLYGDANTWHAYARPVGAVAPASSTPAPKPAPAPAPRPAPAPAPKPAPRPARPGQCVVEAGDTFSSIAAQFGVSLAALEAANPGLNYNLIHVGQVLNLPGGGAAVAPKPAVYRARQCIVERGDTLAGIASQFGTTVAHLVAVNGIKNPNLIHPGQVLNF
jgi:GH25 family lysozyme M1 (1,4-beta-N-acetylmuramidase)/LysM repeat protein